MIKTLSKVEIEATYLNLIKAIYDKPTASIILSGQNYKHSPWDWEQDRDILFHLSYPSFMFDSGYIPPYSQRSILRYYWGSKERLQTNSYMFLFANHLVMLKNMNSKRWRVDSDKK